jgi:putative transposase
MIRKPQTTGFWQGRLPHWEVEDGRYFVTIHLAGAIPKSAAEQIRIMSKELTRKSSVAAADSDLMLTRTIFREMEKWLDSSQDNLLLSETEIANMVLEAIQHRAETQQWIVHQFVIMPNHAHLFLSVVNGTLKETIDGFKRWTGHQAAKIALLSGDRFWQDEWFDHWSRSDEQDDRIIRYIRGNPVKAGLVKDTANWKYVGAFQ